MSDKESGNSRSKFGAIDIKGDFSDFDRIFFQDSEKDDHGSLLLFSQSKQIFMRLDLDTKIIAEMDIHGERQYQQVEVYDKKIFCIDRQNLVMDVFFLSRKQQLYHKRTFRFSKKELRLKEDFYLTVWEHNEAGMIYRCLLGPLEDGRYMNFDLLERYFDYKTNGEQTIDKVICINMAPDDREGGSEDIILALDEVRKSFICYDRNAQVFFENNDFGEGDSRFLEMMFKTWVTKNKIRRMYFYYPYDFFSQKEKNQLKAIARGVNQEMKLDAFVRDKYKEVLVCMEDGPLFKIKLMEDLFLKNNDKIWKIIRLDETNGYIPRDLTINGHTGEIYCLCGREIRVLPNSGSRPLILPELKIKGKVDYYSYYNS